MSETKTTKVIETTVEAKPTPPPDRDKTPVGQTEPSTESATKCKACGNVIFRHSNRVELNGALLRVFGDNKHKQLDTLANGGAWCNVHCFSAFASRL